MAYRYSSFISSFSSSLISHFVSSIRSASMGSLKSLVTLIVKCSMIFLISGEMFGRLVRYFMRSIALGPGIG